MGGNLALQTIAKDIDVVGKARSRKPELEEKGVKVVSDYKSFVYGKVEGMDTLKPYS
jgi:hypothetical protein